MKAILVTDMPKSCGECPFWLEEYYICPHMDDPLKNERHKDCPLKPIPKKRKIRSDIDELIWDRDAETIYALGFNRFLEELEK